MTQTVDLAAVPQNGLTQLQVQAFDSGGSMGSTAVQLTVDDPRPQLSFRAANPTLVAPGGFFDVAVDASEDPSNAEGATVARVEYALSAPADGISDVETVAPYLWHFPVPTLQHGVAIWGRAVDDHGNAGPWSSIDLVVDSGPKLSNVAPTAGSVLRGGYQSISVSADPANADQSNVYVYRLTRVDVYLDRVKVSTWTPTCGQTNCDQALHAATGYYWRPTPAMAGAHAWHAVATDDQGATTTLPTQHFTYNPGHSLATLGPGGQLLLSDYDAPASSWGGNLLGAPALVNSGAAVVAYAVGKDHQIDALGDTGVWAKVDPSSTYCLHVAAAAVPAAPDHAGTVTVACEAADHSLWSASAPVQVYGNTNALGPWAHLGGTMAGGPAVAIVGGKPTYLITGTDGYLRLRMNTTSWQRLAIKCAGRPALADTPAGPYLACRGAAGHLLVSHRTGTGWSAPMSIGGVVRNTPALVADYLHGGVNIWVQNGGTTVYHNHVTGTVVAGWQHTPFTTTAGVAAVSPGPTQ